MTNIKKEQFTIPVVMDSDYRMPKSFSEFGGEELMSNFDRQIVKETAEAIKGEKLFSRYAGWNFNGIVWYEHEKWLCEVWRFREWQETFVCDTLEEIMTEVSDDYGYE